MLKLTLKTVKTFVLVNHVSSHFIGMRFIGIEAILVVFVAYFPNFTQLHVQQRCKYNFHVRGIIPGTSYLILQDHTGLCFWYVISFHCTHSTEAVLNILPWLYLGHNVMVRLLYETAYTTK
jgi:hypothetical protein